MLPHAKVPFRSNITNLPLPPSLPESLDTFSFGNCTSNPDFPTSHCIPSLWFWLLITFFFAAIGFSIIGVLKLIQCYRMRQRRLDVYLDGLEGCTGGKVEAGTSSLPWSQRERWVDLEQRAWLYSPNPGATFDRIKDLSEGETAKKQTKLSFEMNKDAKIEDDVRLAKPPGRLSDIKCLEMQNPTADFASGPRRNGRPKLAINGFWPEHSSARPPRSMSMP